VTDRVFTKEDHAHNHCQIGGGRDTGPQGPTPVWSATCTVTVRCPAAPAPRHSSRRVGGCRQV
jgi:hypothetical protein